MAISPSRILVRDRDRAFALAERTGAARVRTMLERARKDLEKRLAALPSSATGRYTAERMRATLAQIRTVEQQLAAQMGKVIKQQSRAMTKLAMEDTAKYLRGVEKEYSGMTIPLALERAALFDEEVEGVQASLLRQHESSVARYGGMTIARMEKELMQGVVQQKLMDDVIADVVDTDQFFATHQSWAERIVRTETLSSYGRSSLRAIEVTRQRDWPDMRKVLVGYFDSRTGEDTYVMDGQVRKPEDPFIYKHPRGYRRPPFMATPKRPNCR